MLRDGEYAAWYRTPRGEGTGIIVLAKGKIAGGDSVLTYSGWYEVNEDRFTATLSTKRHTAGQPTLFGIDEVELKLTGQSNGTTASCSGIALQAPELPFHATLIRVQGQPLLVTAMTGKRRFAKQPVRQWSHFAPHPPPKLP
ncbi:hypothetical protein [Bradyrhizobium canariense]|uniref:T3SS negative regulator,GrlR n=1 Tax=Bradyrhizobium canariense TaxID=255045 RepID=A0A1H1MZZ6_9BRAD|nr:hypothetical protein [Bradyrhizobium canariense]SDR92441.1 T3SS negative regulator,GrlR [Bradyrhizobium canariense]